MGRHCVWSSQSRLTSSAQTTDHHQANLKFSCLLYLYSNCWECFVIKIFAERSVLWFVMLYIMIDTLYSQAVEGRSGQPVRPGCSSPRSPATLTFLITGQAAWTQQPPTSKIHGRKFIQPTPDLSALSAARGAQTGAGTPDYTLGWLHINCHNFLIRVMILINTNTTSQATQLAPNTPDKVLELWLLWEQQQTVSHNRTEGDSEHREQITDPCSTYTGDNAGPELCSQCTLQSAGAELNWHKDLLRVSPALWMCWDWVLFYSSSAEIIYQITISVKSPFWHFHPNIPFSPAHVVAGDVLCRVTVPQYDCTKLPQYHSTAVPQYPSTTPVLIVNLAMASIARSLWTAAIKSCRLTLSWIKYVIF